MPGTKYMVPDSDMLLKDRVSSVSLVALGKGQRTCVGCCMSPPKPMYLSSACLLMRHRAETVEDHPDHALVLVHMADS